MITDFYLNIGEVTRLTSLSKSNIYARIRAGTFPAQTIWTNFQRKAPKYGA